MVQVKSTSKKAYLFWGFLGMVALVLFVFNCLTPFVADDFTFAFSYRTGEKLTGIWDVLQSQWTHYFTWSGRFLIKTLDQWFTIQPKLLFNVCNTAVFLGLGLLMYQCTKKEGTRYDFLLLAGIFLSFWLVAPVFGQTNLWMCGSFNYLWASFFCFAAATPYLRFLKQPFAAKRWMPLTVFLLGIFGGWSSENTSAGLLVLLVCSIAWIYVTQKRIPLWSISGFLGALAGYLLLILAPGNYLREDAGTDSRGIVTILCTRFITALNMLWDYGLALILLFAVLYWLLWQQQTTAQQRFVPAVLFLSGLAANFAMVLSPVYYPRSTHGVFMFFTAACAACLSQLTAKPIRSLLSCAAVSLGVVVCFQVLYAGYDIASFYTMHRVRTALILEEKSQGSTDIVSYSIEPYTRWCSGYGLPDLRQDATNWICLDMAKYYGLNSICSSEAKTYPFPGFTNDAFEAGLENNE